MQNVEKTIDDLQNIVHHTDNLQDMGVINVGFIRKQWGLAKEFSQEQMAQKCGVHRNTYVALQFFWWVIHKM